ncbi:hypothetical protein CCR75_008678 [Bremia lactucae]|uniref:Reverse transcriptase domain-containing protein n=1 Tax=Bremia lactucae TaxID=4779 RepID=A0A976FLZ0_BRELC|nr:hypothetical protein CCR75_008678 [Bremia lactucae]
MDMQEDDIKARIVGFIAPLNKIVAQHCLLVKSQNQTQQEQARSKYRTKILIASLAPEMLKKEISRMIREDPRSSLRSCCSARANTRYEIDAKHGRKLPTTASTSSKKFLPAVAATTSTSAAPPSNHTRRAAPSRDRCLVCNGDHWMSDCLTARKEHKEQARALLRARGSSQVLWERLERGQRYDRGVRHHDRTAVPDQESDTSIVPLSLLKNPVSVQVVGGAELIATEQALIDVQNRIGAGPVNIRGVNCLVLDEDKEQFVLGKNVLVSLGNDAGSMIEQLAVSSEHGYDADDLDLPNCDVGVDVEDDITMKLADLQRAANAEECDDDGLADELFNLAMKYKSVWRSKLGADPPAKVDPLRVQFAEGAVQVTSKARPYPREKSDFLRVYVADLVRLGLVTRNNHSHWSSPALLIRKSPVDDYTRVNSLSVSIAGAMPDMRTLVAKFYARFDNYKGFWQLALHSRCQEQFSLVTKDAIYTPTRVPQGATDSATHYHNQMHTVYVSMLYDSLLIWIDDIIVFPATRKQAMDRLVYFVLPIGCASRSLTTSCFCAAVRQAQHASQISGTQEAHSLRDRCIVE